MNNYVESELCREIELLLKQTCLARFIGAVVDPGLDFFLGFALQGASENLNLFLLGFRCYGFFLDRSSLIRRVREKIAHVLRRNKTGYHRLAR